MTIQKFDVLLELETSNLLLAVFPVSTNPSLLDIELPTPRYDPSKSFRKSSTICFSSRPASTSTPRYQKARRTIRSVDISRECAADVKDKFIGWSVSITLWIRGHIFSKVRMITLHSLFVSITLIYVHLCLPALFHFRPLYVFIP